MMSSKDIYKKIAVKVHPDKKHGDEEKWSGGQSEKQLKEQIKKDIEQVKKFKK